MHTPAPRERGVYRVEDWAEVQRLFHREGLTKRAQEVVMTLAPTLEMQRGNAA